MGKLGFGGGIGDLDGFREEQIRVRVSASKWIHTHSQWIHKGNFNFKNNSNAACSGFKSLISVYAWKYYLQALFIKPSCMHRTCN